MPLIKRRYFFHLAGSTLAVLGLNQLTILQFDKPYGRVRAQGIRKSLRAVLQKRGFTGSLISVRGVAKSLGLNPPISVKQLINLIQPLPTVPIPGGSGSWGGGGGVGTGVGETKKMASYSYTCEPLPTGVKFTVNGENFPTTTNTQVTISPQFDGIFTAFGVNYYCGRDASSKDSFGPFPVDATGKFNTTVTVLYGCESSCSVRLFVACNKLLRSQIIDPGGPYCQCS